MKLIIGLGNPGKKYKDTRHNIGWEILDFLYEKYFSFLEFTDWKEKKDFKSEISQGILENNEKIFLVKPQTFMNKSGEAVQALINYYDIPVKDIIVIQDEMDLEISNYKIQKDISSAGHKGIDSIIEYLNTQEFYRIRIGISKPESEKIKQGPTEQFVLQRFDFQDNLKLKKVKEDILEEVKKLLGN